MVSLLDRMEPLLAAMPAVKSPVGHVALKNKLFITIGILILYFALTNVDLFGIVARGFGASVDFFVNYRMLLGGGSNSILHLGIGPIVTASIILQLLKGADLIHIDTSDIRGQIMYMGVQKLLIFIMIIAEAIPLVIGMRLNQEVVRLFGGYESLVILIVILQVCIGGVIIFFLDEVVTKWGLGSGVGLFIVAGISQSMFQWLFSPFGFQGHTFGFFPLFVRSIQDNGLLGALGDVRYKLLAIGVTLLIFSLVVYFESTRVEIPVSHSTVRGARARYPVKLIYASVLPMILVKVLQANIQLLGMFLYNYCHIDLLGKFAEGGGATDGIMWYLSPISGPHDWMWWESTFSPIIGDHAPWAIMIRIGLDIFFTIGGGIIFALFWVQTSGLDSSHVAKRIQASGMSIPGHRQSPQFLERYLDRYIPRITIIGGFFVGLLTIVSSLFGVIGDMSVSGTGLLLVVSIIYRLYEEIAKEQMMSMYPMLRTFFGKE